MLPIFFRSRLAVALAIVAILIASPAGPAHAADGAKLRVQLRWFHQGQFAGYYVAEAQGFNGHPGEVELTPSGPGLDSMELLAKGETDVAIGWLADALRARMRGADIVNVAQVFRRSGMGVACVKRSGVGSPSDLAGREVGVWKIGDEISVHLWLQRARVAENAVRYVQQAADAQDVISGRVPCGTVMFYNEYWSLLGAGFKSSDLYIVRFGSAGLGMLEDGLYVRRERLEDPAFRARVANFVAASAAGWKYARAHPDKALALTLAKSPALDPTHQRRMLQSVLDLIPADSPFGQLDRAEYQRTVEIYAHGSPNAEEIRAAAVGGWTDRVRAEASSAKRRAAQAAR